MKTIEEIRSAFLRIHRAACGDERSRGYMSIPADAERDADIIVAVAIDELERLRVYVAGEPARIAAAREEQREACARQLLVPGLSTQQDENLAQLVRTTPLIATPLADRIAELEAEVTRRDALLRTDGYEEMRQHAQELALRAEKAEARVRELEAEAKSLRHDADTEWGASATERETLRTQLREVLAALRQLEKAYGVLTHGFTGVSFLTEPAHELMSRAWRVANVLAKYPEEK